MNSTHKVVGEGRDQTMLSVVVPVFNGQPYIEKCLGSILTQKVAAMEIIVVDDGSTDGSGELCRRILAGHKNSRVIWQKNAGLGNARNTGLAASEGKYVGFVDADDWIDDQMYSKLIESAERFGSDLVICDVRGYDEDKRRYTGFFDGSVWRELRARFPDTVIRAQEFPRVFLLEAASWRRLYRREFLISQRIVFPSGLLYEDMPVHFQGLQSASAITFVHEKLYTYRINRNESKLSNSKGRRVFDIFRVFRQIHAYLDSQQTGNQFKYMLLHFELRTYFWLEKTIAVEYRKEFRRSALRYLRAYRLNIILKYMHRHLIHKNLIKLVLLSVRAYI